MSIQNITKTMVDAVDLTSISDYICTDTVQQNFLLLRRLDEFCSLGCPVLTGTSRKSFIGNVAGADMHERSGGTAASVVLSAAAGADIVRVHDVKLMKQVVLVTDTILTA